MACGSAITRAVASQTIIMEVWRACVRAERGGSSIGTYRSVPGNDRVVVGTGPHLTPERRGTRDSIAMRLQLVDQLHRIGTGLPHENRLGAHPNLARQRNGFHVIDEVVQWHVPLAELLACLRAAHGKAILDAQPHAIVHECHASHRPDSDSRDQLVSLSHDSESVSERLSVTLDRAPRTLRSQMRMASSAGLALQTRVFETTRSDLTIHDCASCASHSLRISIVCRQ